MSQNEIALMYDKDACSLLLKMTGMSVVELHGARRTDREIYLATGMTDANRRSLI